MQRTVKNVLNFLHSLKTKGLDCSIINSARSTLSLFISLDGLEAVKRPLVFRLMNGLHNINPSSPKYRFTCDLGIIMKYLNGYQLLSKEILILKKDLVMVSIGDIFKLSIETFNTGEIKFPNYRDKTV